MHLREDQLALDKQREDLGRRRDALAQPALLRL